MLQKSSKRNASLVKHGNQCDFGRFGEEDGIEAVFVNL
jgi:hypothetical protein